MRAYLAVIVLIVTIIGNECKVYTRCGFRDELLKRSNLPQFYRTYIPNWVCLVDSESARNTSKISGGPGRYKYGIFQIIDKFCQSDPKRVQPNKLCNVNCSAFLDENLDDDIVCAGKIFDTQGWKTWSGWENACKNRDLRNYLAYCFPP